MVWETYEKELKKYSDFFSQLSNSVSIDSYQGSESDSESHDEKLWKKGQNVEFW